MLLQQGRVKMEYCRSARVFPPALAPPHHRSFPSLAPRMNSSFYSLVIAFCCACAGGLLFAQEAPQPSAKVAAEVTFQRDVLPFIKAHCFHCHGTADGKNKADLSLSKYQDDLSV